MKRLKVEITGTRNNNNSHCKENGREENKEKYIALIGIIK